MCVCCDCVVDDVVWVCVGVCRVVCVVCGKLLLVYDDDDDVRGEVYVVEIEWKSVWECVCGGEVCGGDGWGCVCGGGAERVRVFVVREVGEGYFGVVVVVVCVGVGWDEV